MVRDWKLGDLPALNMEYKFSFLNQTHTIKIEKTGDGYQAIINDRFYKILNYSLSGNILTLNANGDRIQIYIAEDRGRIYVSVNGEYYVLEPETTTTPTGRGVGMQKGNSVSSPMPGLLVKLPVNIGDRVTAGTILAIVEAMKMQNELKAPIDGKVKKINYKVGDQVDAFVPIVELE